MKRGQFGEMWAAMIISWCREHFNPSLTIMKVHKMLFLLWIFQCCQIHFGERAHDSLEESMLQASARTERRRRRASKSSARYAVSFPNSPWPYHCPLWRRLTDILTPPRSAP